MAELNWGSGFRYLQDGIPVYNLQGINERFGLDASTFGLNANADGGLFNLGISYNNNADLDGNGLGSFQQDIAQNRYFTVTVSEIKDKNGKPITFHTGGAFHDFLPVKSMSLSYTSYENLSVPLASLAGVPILSKKRLSIIKISCYDTDDDIIEKAVQRWEQRCFPYGKYVAYMDEVAAEFQYKSYDVKGNLVFVKTLYVIPSDDVNVNRDYDSNAEKLVHFSLAAVGEPGVSANLNAYKGFNDTFEKAPEPAGSETSSKSTYDQGIPLPPLNYPPVENTTATSEYDLYDSVVGRAINDRVNGTTTVDLD